MSYLKMMNKNFHQWSKRPLVNTPLVNQSLDTGQSVLRVLVNRPDTKETITKETNTKEMKNKKYFLNERRKEKGLPLMEYKLTEKQKDFFDGSKLIPIFQKAVIDYHSLSYWKHPDDIADLEKENSRINGQIKIFWKRCDKDLKKATAVIEWYAGDYGKWKNWSPGFCFRKDTVSDYEAQNKKETKNYIYLDGNNSKT